MGKARKRLQSFFYFVLVWTLIALAFSVISYFGGLSEGRTASFRSVAISNFVRFYLWAALFPLIFGLTRKFGFDSKRHYLRNLLIHIFLGVFFSTAHLTAGTYLAWLFSPMFRERYASILPYLQSSFSGSLYLGLTFYALIVVAAQAYLSRLNYIAEEKKAATLQSELVEAQLQALKMQLQPHFLFNTLNSISSLVLVDPPKAHEMIAQLGDFLRLTLDYNEDQMVLLKEELRFLRSYLDIEQTRFSDRLTVDFDVEKDVLTAFVPHLVLQPLVENSIKHGISRLNGGGKIEIKAAKQAGKLRLQVKNDTPETNFDETNSGADKRIGTGLFNVRTRLRHLYGEDFSFEMKNGDGATVTLLLPLKFDFATPDSKQK